MSAQNKGFTLVELMVVISIIAILSVIGITVFTNVQKGARDSKRREDVDAISKAYEVSYTNRYRTLTAADFASGIIPQDSTKGDYFNVLSSDGSGFKVCAALEANPADVCNTQAANCFCQISSMGTITQDSSLSGTHVELGLGGGSSPSCDPNGTLTAGLVGYWKMDEPSWNGTAGEVKDWTGSNPGTAAGGANTTPGKFSNAGNFNGSTSYVNIVNKVLFTTEFTVEAWFYKSIWKDTGVPDASAGKMEDILSKWDRLPGADVGYRFERWYGGGYFGIGVSSRVANSSASISMGVWWRKTPVEYIRKLPMPSITHTKLESCRTVTDSSTASLMMSVSTTGPCLLRKLPASTIAVMVVYLNLFCYNIFLGGL